MSGTKPDTVVDAVEPENKVQSAPSSQSIQSNQPESTADSLLEQNSPTIIEILRHGELEGDDTFRGSTDDDLTDNGWQQMVKALENKNNWDIVITSPLSCCREFAELIAKEEEIDLEINKQLKEIDFGEWENHTPDEIMKSDSELLRAWWQSPTQVTPPDGEDFYDFRARVLKAFKEMLQNYQGKRILLVTHSGVIRILLMKILGMQDENLFRLNVDYASFSKISIENNDLDAKGVLLEHH